VQVQINGQPRELPSGTSLRDLISTLNLAAERVAIEVNHVVVRRVNWPTTVLNEGDRIEIVHFVGGGLTNP
jgi:thiamine biosynthesis protein ThiS